MGRLARSAGVEVRVSYRDDKRLTDAAPTLFGRELPPCLPAGRYPGLDARGRGMWDPYLGFAPTS